ncbi:Ubiquitin--protein ligase [Bertholletia excelsa]
MPFTNSLYNNSQLSMNSEPEVNEPSLLERLVRSRGRNRSLFLPIILGLGNNDITITNNTRQEVPTDPNEEETEGSSNSNPIEARDRIILVNPWTQGMVVIEGRSSRIDSLIQDLLSKEGQPPASKASVDAMASVEVRGEDEGGECVICLEEWEVCRTVVKEMPCKHRFHGECIEKWLGIHGSCPVCRFKMPVDEDVNKKTGVGVGVGDGDERDIRRDIWVSFSLNRDRSVESNQVPSSNSEDSSPLGLDHAMEY